MWRHGLLLRCKPSYVIFKEPAVSLISKTSYLNPKIYVKNIFTNNLSLFSPIRSYSKSVPEVLPEISLEVKRTDSVDIDPNVGKPNTFVFVEGDGAVPEDKSVDKVMVIKSDVGLIDSEELCLNGVKSILKGTDSEGVLRHISSPGRETDSEDKASQKDVKVIVKDITIKNNEIDLEEVSVNDIEPSRKDVTDRDPGPQIENNKSDSKEQVTPKDAWFCVDETPVRRYEHDQHQILYEAIVMTNELTSEQWDELHERVLSAGNIVNKENIQGSIMEQCFSHKRLGAGLSYLNYLSASAQEPNIATIGTFSKLAFNCPSELNDNIQDIITSSYDSLRARYPSFDASTCGSFIQGLCITKRWKEGMEILDEMRLTSIPDKYTYSALIQASFNNDEPDIGWELLSKMVQENKKPMDYIYESWLEYCRRSAAGNKDLEKKLVDKLLNFVAYNDIRLTEQAAISIRLWFEYDAPPEADWDVQFTTVDVRGMCQTCHQRLKLNRVSPEEFESLKSVFIDKTVVGSNIFLKSTPEELEEYKKFIKETAPYDVVIDGLNVGYSISGRERKGNPNNYAQSLQSVVEYFVRRSEKVLVLGRQHMAHWPKRHMDFVYDNADVFLTENLSQDDPFLLYAAMYSGLNTRFISKDLMRGHMFLLKDPKLQSIFLRWQRQYQLQVSHIENDGFVKFKLPDKYNTTAHCNSNGSWHIPYNLKTDSTRHQNYNAPRQWLCISKGQQRYGEGFEDDSYKFRNDRYENREDRVHQSQYRNNIKESQFRRNRPIEDSFDSSDDETATSPVWKRNVVNRGFDDNKQSKFGRIKAAAEKYDDFDDDEDQPSQYVKHRPRQVYSKSDDFNDESPQFRKGRYVDQRFAGERPKFRSVSRMADGEDSSDEETFRSKQRPSDERLKNDMLESESKQAFKASQTRQKLVRKEDD